MPPCWPRSRPAPRHTCTTTSRTRRGADSTPGGPSYTTWGPADYGGTWAEFSTKCDSSRDDFSVSGGKGVVATNNLAAEHDCQRIDIGQQTLEYTGKISVSATPSGGSVWGYLGVRVKDRDNAYRLRVELTQAGEAKCLMQEEATDTNGDGTVDDPNGITSTLPAGGATKTLSGLDYTGASDEVSIKMEADAANDTVKGKCWSSASESPAAGTWDWTASSETTLEGSSFDRIQIRTTTADAITNDSRIRFDDLNAHSIGHVNPKIGAAGDIACSPSPSADGVHPTVWGSGEGTNSSCQQKWVSDLICDTAGIAVPSDGSCDTNDATGSGYDKILLAGDIQYDCPRPSLFANGWGQLNSLGTYPVGWQRVQNVSNLVRPVPGNHEANRTPCGMTTTAGYDDGECYFQQFNGLAGSPVTA